MAGRLRDPDRARSGIRRPRPSGEIRPWARGGGNRSRSTLRGDRGCTSRAHARVARACEPGDLEPHPLTPRRSRTADAPPGVSGGSRISCPASASGRFPGPRPGDFRETIPAARVLQRLSTGIPAVSHPWSTEHNILGFEGPLDYKCWYYRLSLSTVEPYADKRSGQHRLT